MLTVAELAKRIGAKLIGDGSAGVCAVGPLEAASPDQITFVSDKKHLALFAKTQAAAVIAREQISDSDRPQLIVSDVDAALIKTLKVLAPKLKPAPPGTDATAVVGEGVQVDKSASIGAGVVLADGVKVASGAIIGPGCKIGQNSGIGENTRLDANVVVYHGCTIGNNVIIQANTTVGSTGFGYSQIDGQHKLIPHNGGVVIEDFAEVGANCCIDRAKFGNTMIGAGTKIDNLVQIAHNVIIGQCCLIIGQAGIAGSSRLGDGVIMAGQVGVVDNVKIGNGVLIGAQAGVMRDIPDGKKVVGSPAIDYTEEIRLLAMRARLPKMAKQLKQLVKRIENLEAADDDRKGS